MHDINGFGSRSPYFVPTSPADSSAAGSPLSQSFERLPDLRLDINFVVSEECLNRIYAVQNLEIREAMFKMFLEKQFKVIPIKNDGDCFFTSMAQALKYDTIAKLKSELAGYLILNPVELQPFLTQDFVSYARKIMTERFWGGEEEIALIVEYQKYLRRPIEIHVYDVNHRPVILGDSIYPSSSLIYGSNDNMIIHLYRAGNHYSLLELN